MKILSLDLSLFFVLCLMPMVAHLQDLHLLPIPQSVEINEDVFEVSQNLQTYSLLELESIHPIEEQIDLIQEDLKARGSSSNKNLLWYGTIDQDLLLNVYCTKNNITVPEHNEGYILHLSNDTIIIAASKKAGVLYGLYTLEQIVKNTKDKLLPEVTIVDFPNYDHRAIMDDISRGPLSNMTFLKSQIKRLAKLKVNILTFYIEHVVKTKSHPDFAPEEAITIEEFKELTAFAKPYNIELMGGFQSLGHFRNILSSETYRHLGQTDRMLKPGHPESIAFLKSVYAEMIPAFSSEYFGIYADEAWDLVKMDEGLEVDSSAAAQRYISHVNPLMNYLIDMGITPIIASDMLLSFPETIDEMPKEATVLSWVYDDLDNYDYWLDPFRQADLDIWVCPGILNSYQIFPDYDVAFGNLEGFINAGYEKGATRVMTTIWDDGSAHLFARDWPAVAYAANQSWKPKRNDNDTFNKAFSFLKFGDEDLSLLDCISSFSELKNTKTLENLGTTFLDELLLSEDGQAHYLNTSEAESIFKIIREGKTCLNTISKPTEESTNLWAKDLEAWHFALDRISMQLSNYEKLIDLSEMYSASQLTKISSELQNLVDGWVETKERFTSLWLIENRTYWLDNETEIYDRKIKTLSKLKLRIDSIYESQIPLPSAASIGIDVRPLDKDYFTYWLISERFEAGQAVDIDKDFLSDLGGEKMAKPTPYDWTKTQSPYAYKVDFKDVDGKYIVYLYSRIETEEHIEVTPEVGFSGKWKMILNGNEVLNNNTEDGQVTLEKGKNHVIIKLQLEQDMKQVRFSLANARTTNKKYKYNLIKNE